MTKHINITSFYTTLFHLLLIQSCQSFLVPTSFHSSTTTTTRWNKPFLHRQTGTSFTSLDASRICILGGGFGGINAALTLSTLPWKSSSGKPSITLIDPKERFVFLPLLYELCVGDASLEEVAPTYKSLLRNTDIEFIQGNVNGIDSPNNTLYLNSDGDCCMKYDALIIATGMQPDLSVVSGAEELALPFYTIEDCYELKKRLNVLENRNNDFEMVNVVIVGAGYSGVELGLNLMERLGGPTKASVSLVQRGNEILSGVAEYNRDTAVKRLKDAGVEVLTGTSVQRVTAVETNQREVIPKCNITLATKNDSQSTREITADLLLWTAGAKPPSGSGPLNSILPRDKSGRIVTGPLLRVKDTTNIFCIGDASRAKKENYPANAQVAMQQAQIAAWNVYSTLEQKGTLVSFRYNDLGQMMTLGNDDASISGLGGLVKLSGGTASFLRRLVYAARMPTGTQVVVAGALGIEEKLEDALEKKVVKKIGGNK